MRQLAAILFADIVGYTALMGRDEDRAFQAVSQFKETAQPLVDRHQGHWHKDLGDGALCSFGSALDAVQAAIAIQRKLNAEADFKVRIGIHLGDVTYRDGDIFGDGVNVASRVQGEAALGGICISDTVFRNIRNKKEIATHFIGTKKLKNVDVPLKLFQIEAAGIEASRLPGKRQVSLPLYFVSLLLMAILSAAFYKYAFMPSISPDAGQRSSGRFSIVLPEAFPLAFEAGIFGAGYTSLALSPDGSNLVYVTRSGEQTHLVLRPMDQFECSSIPSTEGAFNPFFSPDGNWVAYFSEGELRKIAIEGGSSVTLCEVADPWGACWLPNDSIYISTNQGATLMKLHAKGESPELVLAGMEPMLLSPYSTSGETLFVQLGLSKEYRAVNLKGEITGHFRAGSHFQYHPRGFAFYTRERQLFYQAFDPDQLVFTGREKPMVEQIRVESILECAQYSFSKNGTVVYAVGPHAEEGLLISTDLKGVKDTLPFDRDLYDAFRVSPDGRKIAIRIRGVNSNIFVLDLVHKSSIRISEEGYNLLPVWTPRGDAVLFSSYRNRKWHIIKKSSSGNGPPEIIMVKDHFIGPHSWSSDGEILSYVEISPEKGWDIGLYSPDKVREIDFLYRTDAGEWGLTFSPGDRYVAYTAINPLGGSEIMVEPFPPTGEKWLIAPQGEEPVWAADGKMLFYHSSGKGIVGVPIEANSSEMKWGEPIPIVEFPFFNLYGQNYDISPDGNRFYVVGHASSVRSTNEIRLVNDWLEELE